MSDLQTNINSRKEAESFIDLCGEQPQRFWECLAELVAANLPAKPAPTGPLAPMDEKEAIWFEAQPMPFGAHIGREVGVVPCGYLAWVEDSAFNRNMRRYLKSERFKRRQESETDDD